MPTISKKICSFLILCFAAGIFLIGEQAGLEPYLSIELKRLEETYRVLDRFAEEIWPGWNNYDEVEYRVRFPNLVDLLYNPRKELPDGYVPLADIKLRGKPVYINRSKEVQLKLEPPLNGGGGGGLIIKIKLRPIPFSPELYKEIIEQMSKKDSEIEPGYEPPVSSESQILMNVHEYFHGFQQKLGVIESTEADLSDFQENTGYAVYSHIEGLALINAWNEKDNSRALEYVKDFMTARQLKYSFMPADMAAAERSTTLVEGSASYADIKMAELIRDNRYRPGMSRKDDPFFFDFRFMTGHIDNQTIFAMPYSVPMTFNNLGKCYEYGAYQCFLLDRFAPGWKKNFFQDKNNLDDAMLQFLQLSVEEKEKIANRLKTRYSYNQLFALHDAAIKKREQTILSIKSRLGTKYIVDCKETGEFFMISGASNDLYFVGIERFYPHGINKYASGQIELTSIDTPLYSPIFSIIEWVDTDIKEGEKGYEISFAEKTGDIYKNLRFKTKGFTLIAPEVRIVNDKEKNEVRLYILTKASRKHG